MDIKATPKEIADLVSLLQGRQIDNHSEHILCDGKDVMTNAFHQAVQEANYGIDEELKD